MRLAVLAAALLIALSWQSSSAQTVLRAERLGIAFINAPGVPNPETRYRNAALLGAGWNRLPLYWNEIERSAGAYVWGAYDRVIADDARHGLRTTLILLGIPDFQRDGAIPRGLYAPTFADGTDALGVGKTPHPSNAWARFVHAAVLRYKPAGAIGGAGVRAWEIWNEPDLAMFWSGTVSDYARLLKVAYLVIKQVDPDAKVIFGGVADGDPVPGAREFLAQTLSVIGQDSARVQYNWYFDVAAVHSYTNPLRTRRSVERTRAILNRFGIDRPIWLTETGIAVWDDYPGPTWTGGAPSERDLRGTQRQQAAYLVQSTALAWAAGAEVVFWHQLYDDCGNQQPGADAGDAHGLFRNDRASSCFNAHPQPGSPRSAAGAFYTLSQVFAEQTIRRSTVVQPGGRAYAAVFDTERSGMMHRITVVWGLRGQTALEVPASAPSAIVYSPNDRTFALTPNDGWYALDLPDSTQVDAPYGSTGEAAYIGGTPYVMVELLLPNAQPSRFAPKLLGSPPSLLDNLSLPAFTPTLIPTAIPQFTATPAQTATPAPFPTFDPALTLAAPLVFMNPLPETSPPVFTVGWGAYDPISTAGYLVWVRVDEGEWTPWQTTTATSAVHEGEAGRFYEFSVWGVNRAGNWSTNVTLTPMAATRVE
jgi:hypothetical protein